MRSSASGSEEEEEGELVPPPVAPAAPAAPADGCWQFDAWRRDSLSRGRTRHASLDAGHLEHRAYAALQALEGRASALPQHHSAGSIHSSSARPSARQAQRNEDIEIGWVWPPCLANDAGPVEFAVNVAPKEWLAGKRSQRRVPCWPVSGLSLHITFGEQLLEMVDLDICGTTKVRLHLPPALTEHKLNFITVMLVDHGSVGPATQLLLMPSSAADEFSGLFRVLVEHAMLPQSAAHPEYVSMLFGSSGCSSASSVRSYNSLASLNGSSLAPPPPPPPPPPPTAAAAAAAAAVSRGLVCPFNPADALMPAPAPAGAPAGGQGGSLQHQALQQQQQPQGATSKVRRSSWIDIQGQPAVVQSWGASMQRGVSPGKERGATGLEQRQGRRSRSHGRRRSCGPGSGGSADRAGVGTGERRQRRASTGVEYGASAAAYAGDSQQPSVFFSTSGYNNLETVLSCNGDSGSLPVPLGGGGGSVVSSRDADDEGRLAAVAAAVAAELQQEDEAEGAADELAPDGRRPSLSLDRCAVHVHNEVERAQHTRSRMSLEEPSICRVSLDLAFASDALLGSAAQGSSHAHALSAAAAAAGGSGGGDGHGAAGGLSRQHSTAQSLAAAAAAFLAHTPPAAAGPAAAAKAGGGSAPVSAHSSLVAPVERSGHSATAAAAGSAAAAAMALGEKLLQVQQQNLERRSSAEAHMAAAFTTAWSSHMLELASDLQYLVVCVPNAFASNLEAWFGRIVDSRASSSSGSAAAAGSSARATERAWDSGMYMRRLGEVLGTLQENGMWRTMSLLLQHCSKGGLDLYPAGRLHEQLQQQAKLQGGGKPASPAAGGPLDPASLTPEYLLHLGSLDIGKAHGWVRPVPTITNVAVPKWGRLSAGGGGGAAAGRSGSNGVRPAAVDAAAAAAASAAGGLVQQREAAAAKGRRGVMSIDLTPASLSDARAAARAAAAAGRGGEPQPGAQQLQGQQQHQQHRQHRAPRRSISWPLGILYSALTWAQTAQLRHRHRSFWSRALAGLHSLPEGSERGSESSVASSTDTSSFRSSSSTQRDSIMSVVQPDTAFEPAPWAAGGGGRGSTSAAAAGRPTSPAVKPRTSAAGAARSSLQHLAGTGRRSASANSAAPAASRASQGSAAGSAAAAASTSGRASSSAAVGGGQPHNTSRSLSEAEQRIAALQSSLFAQAVLPPAKTVQKQAGAAGAAAAVTAAAAAGTGDAPDTTAARLVCHADDQQQHHQQKGAACAHAGTADALVSAAPPQPAAAASVTPAVGADKGSSAAATAAAAVIAADARTACIDQRPQLERREQQLPVAADAEQRVAHDAGLHTPPPTAAPAAAAARPVSDAAAEQRGVRVAAALRVAGQVEHGASQLLLALLLPCCLCYLPSIMPGLQPPHLVAAMAQRPAWFEAALLVLLWLHLYAGASRRRDAGCTRELHAAAVAAVADANAAVAAATEAAAAAAAAAASSSASSDDSTQPDTQAHEAAAVSAARRRRRRQEHRLLRLRQRQVRLLARSLVSSAAAAAAIAAIAYSQHVFVRAWLHTVHGGSTSSGSCAV